MTAATFQLLPGGQKPEVLKAKKTPCSSRSTWRTPKSCLLTVVWTTYRVPLDRSRDEKSIHLHHPNGRWFGFPHNRIVCDPSVTRSVPPSSLTRPRLEVTSIGRTNGSSPGCLWETKEGIRQSSLTMGSRQVLIQYFSAHI